MSGPRRGALVAWPCVLLACSGCGVSVGPSVGRTVNSGAAWTAGPAVGYRTWPLSSRGLVVGGDAEARGSDNAWNGRLTGGLGYGVLPLPHRSAVGVEVTGQPGIAWRRIDGDTHFAGVLDWRLGLPLRVSPWVAPWNQSNLAEPIHLIVPSIRFGHELRLGEGSDRVQHDLSFGVSYRFHLWPAVKP
jgi:hypothetical protein